MALRAVFGALVFCCGATCYALLGILSQLSKSEDGTYAYSMPSVVLLAELSKLCLSAARLTADLGSWPAARRAISGAGSFWRWGAYAVPSVLFSINNNLDMMNNQHMDPATEQVLVQCKILTTGLVWWFVFGEPLGPRKWLALLLLFLGAVLAGWPANPREQVGKTMFIDSVGVVLVVLYVWISAGAGVYNEWLYKGISKKENIHACNVRLYSIGILFNLAAHCSQNLEGAGLSGLLEGYNRYVCGLVATYTLMGLLIAQVMKFFDNIVKLFMSGASMYVSAVLSWAIFGYRPTPTFVAAMMIVTAAMLLYNVEHIFAMEKRD